MYIFLQGPSLVPPTKSESPLRPCMISLRRLLSLMNLKLFPVAYMKESRRLVYRMQRRYLGAAELFESRTRTLPKSKR